MTFQYFRENFAYHAPIMLIMKPQLQYLVYSFSTLPLKLVQVLKNQYMVGGSDIIIMVRCAPVSYTSFTPSTWKHESNSNNFPSVKLE